MAVPGCPYTKWGRDGNISASKEVFTHWESRTKWVEHPNWMKWFTGNRGTSIEQIVSIKSDFQVYAETVWNLEIKVIGQNTKKEWDDGDIKLPGIVTTIGWKPLSDNMIRHNRKNGKKLIDTLVGKTCRKLVWFKQLCKRCSTSTNLITGNITHGSESKNMYAMAELLGKLRIGGLGIISCDVGTLESDILNWVNTANSQKISICNTGKEESPPSELINLLGFPVGDDQIRITIPDKDE